MHNLAAALGCGPLQVETGTHWLTTACQPTIASAAGVQDAGADGYHGSKSEMSFEMTRRHCGRLPHMRLRRQVLWPPTLKLLAVQSCPVISQQE